MDINRSTQVVPTAACEAQVWFGYFTDGWSHNPREVASHGGWG